MSDVYLSYLDVDRARATLVREALERLGLSCRMQLVDAGPEAMLADFRSALSEVSVILALVTRNCLGDPLAGFVAATEGWRGQIVLVIADDVIEQELPPALRRLARIPLSRLDWLPDLLQPLRHRMRPAAASPAAPGSSMPPLPPPAAPALPRLPAAHDGPRPSVGGGGGVARPAFPAAAPSAARPPVAASPAPDLDFMEQEAAPAPPGMRPTRLRAVNDPLSVEDMAWLGARMDPPPRGNRFEDVLTGKALSAPSPSALRRAGPMSAGPSRPTRVAEAEPPDRPASEVRQSATTVVPPPPTPDQSSLDDASADRRRESFPDHPSLPPPAPSPERSGPPLRVGPAPEPMAAPRIEGSRGPVKSGGGGVVGVLAMVVAALLGAVLVGTSTGQGVLAKLIAALGMKLNAFSFFGFKSRKDELPAAPQSDLVDCSVFAPAAAAPGSTVLVQVFLHTATQAERAQFMATVMDASTSFKGVQTLQTEIARGARVGVTLSGNGLAIEEPAQTVVWRGEPVFAQFLVTLLPAVTGATTFHAVARISVEGGLVGRIVFAITADPAAAGQPSQPAGKSARRYERAFLSYAAADRKEVLKRAQILKAAGVGFFQDILSLDPGARWEREIYRNIDGCDLFLLFWSRAARDSEWVIREAEYALARAGGGDVPDIVPVILEGPPVVVPPDSLKALHFNDQISYLMALS